MLLEDYFMEMSLYACAVIAFRFALHHFLKKTIVSFTMIDQLLAYD